MEATIVYPHQLFEHSPAISKNRFVYIVEESLILTHNPIHRQKLALHKLSMDAYECELTDRDIKVERISIKKYPTTESVFAHFKQAGVTKMHIVDTTDDYLEDAIKKSNIERVWYESPLFILSKDKACHRFIESKRYMASFYKQLRIDCGILLEQDKKPTGGKWSFDEDNRKKLPKDIELPEDITFFGNTDTKQAESWVDSIGAETYGSLNHWLPYTRAGAETYLRTFLTDRFVSFGTYEDAISTRGARLFHSTLSPLINIGLLTPKQVIDEAVAFGTEHDIPLNSLEGFIRQVVGWREFMRASYEVDGKSMRTKNFWNNTNKLPDSFWDASTGIEPIDHVIKTALEHGYTHHIERLMVMGNFILLTEIDPTEVYRWFMAMYIDAYDWVMVPNVYGMSQFADGGSFATKPYISGANYIKKMSDFESGDWEQIWTALYWNFIHKHRSVFENNHRLSMMPKTLDRMNPETRTEHFDRAADYLANYQGG